MSRSWVAEAPSNIALIKYMGKVTEAAGANRSTNASLSYTLDHLRTRVRVSEVEGPKEQVSWRPLNEPGFHAPVLSESGRARFIKHAERCLKRLNVSRESALVIESANGFPSDCGLASSASSFAALTVAIAKLAGVNVDDLSERKRLAELSREGSGSSCRSLFTPWALWEPTGAVPVEGLPAACHIRHLALIVDEEKKSVSSSEAHVRVTSSLLFRGRVARAEERLRTLLDLLKRSNGADGVHAWNRAAHLVWSESWDMHALFETSDPPFGYFVPGSVQALNALRQVTIAFKLSNGETYREPLVTMDAGPNVHVILWNDDSTDAFVRELKLKLDSKTRVIDSFGSVVKK
ncbi:diphosphomevalonate decarboxylase [soil metagenome]